MSTFLFYFHGFYYESQPFHLLLCAGLSGLCQIFPVTFLRAVLIYDKGHFHFSQKFNTVPFQKAQLAHRVYGNAPDKSYADI
jgi:hypothetical protein